MDTYGWPPAREDGRSKEGTGHHGNRNPPIPAQPTCDLVHPPFRLNKDNGLGKAEVLGTIFQLEHTIRTLFSFCVMMDSSSLLSLYTRETHNAISLAQTGLS